MSHMPTSEQPDGTTYVAGSGTTNTIPIFTDADTIGDSVITFDPQTGVDAIRIARRVIVDYRPNSIGQHGGLIVAAAGAADFQAEGGVQTFNNASYDTTPGPQQAFSFVSESNPTKSGGTDPLTACAALLRATGGDINYCIYVPENSGTARFDGDVSAFNVSVSDTASINALTVDAGADVNGAVVLGTQGAGVGPVSCRGDLTLNGNGHYHETLICQGSALIGNGTYKGYLKLQTQSDASALITGYTGKWYSLYPSGNDLRLWEFDNGVNDTNAGSGADKYNFKSGGTFCAASGFAQLADGSGPVWKSGSGSPEGVLTAPIGSLYSRTNGSTGTTLYVKESGTGNTGWAVAAGSGATFLARQTITASGTYTPTSGAKRITVRMCGGGGGGGGAAGGGNTAAAGGGSSGVYWEKTFTNGSGIAGGSVTIGAAGSAGSAGSNNGGNGGDTSIVIDGVTYTAKGGKGGNGKANGGGWQAALGGAATSGSSAGDVVSQLLGGNGNNWSTDAAIGGTGASSIFGTGGAPGAAGVNVTGAVSGSGSAGSGYGAGGGGAAATSGNNAGGAGMPGVVIIDEWTA